MSGVLESPAGAEISDDGLYRYRLWRTWDEDLPTAVWVMLNPSTADAADDDPTIRRVRGFTLAAGCGSALVVNLYALRATNPRALLHSGAPIGPANFDTIERALAAHPAVAIAAWGDKVLASRIPVRAIAERHGVDLQCLGTTKKGQPRHPLYVAADTPLEAWT